MAVHASGTRLAPSNARSSGGPASDTAVVMTPAADRSTSEVRRLTIVSTTTSDSLASSSSPVTWPVLQEVAEQVRRHQREQHDDDRSRHEVRPDAGGESIGKWWPFGHQ